MFTEIRTVLFPLQCVPTCCILKGNFLVIFHQRYNQCSRKGKAVLGLITRNYSLFNFSRIKYFALRGINSVNNTGRVRKGTHRWRWAHISSSLWKSIIFHPYTLRYEKCIELVGKSTKIWVHSPYTLCYFYVMSQFLRTMKRKRRMKLVGVNS